MTPRAESSCTSTALHTEPAEPGISALACVGTAVLQTVMLIRKLCKLPSTRSPILFDLPWTCGDSEEIFHLSDKLSH